MAACGGPLRGERGEPLGFHQPGSMSGGFLAAFDFEVETRSGGGRWIPQVGRSIFNA